MLKKIHHPSPNFEPRSPGVPLDLIVLHYTDMLTVDEALARLCDAQSKVSAHFLIGKDGALYQLVDPEHRAWHAGVSSWRGERDVNSRSIGIELDNLGHTFGPEPFPIAQMTTLLDLLEDLTKTYAIPPHCIVGHSDVAPLRKKDPGELFPWVDLARKGFGVWPFEKTTLSNLSTAPSMSVSEVQEALFKIGYECSQTGIWDHDSQAVCKAFQRHFTPDELTGSPTNLTHQVLKALMDTTQ